MKRGATREDIIRTTQTLIVRNGIRAVRVDEIAQTLGISKRTLYETFADKTALVNSCLEDMSRKQKLRITDYLQHHDDRALAKVAWLMREYISALQMTDNRFLSDLRQKIDFIEYFEEDRQFWEQAFAQGLRLCKEQGDMLQDVDCRKIAGRLTRVLYELRLANVSRDEQLFICRTTLRGIATQQGIRRIDERQ